jgi:hypothetical protein
VREAAVKRAWDQASQNDNYLLFGSGISVLDNTSLHPEPVQIFQLWQLYLENIDPILKVTHTPSLQARIVEAVSHLVTIEADLEALIFSIYCTAILSLDQSDCQSMFGSSREDLSWRYGCGCQQALVKAAFLRTTNRDCLTALFLYLVGIPWVGLRTMTDSD